MRETLNTTAGAYDDWHEGRDPAGITIQDDELTKRVDPVTVDRRLANYLKVITLECQTLAQACGKFRGVQLGTGRFSGSNDRDGSHGARTTCRHGLDSGPRQILITTEWGAN